MCAVVSSARSIPRFIRPASHLGCRVGFWPTIWPTLRDGLVTAGGAGAGARRRRSGQRCRNRDDCRRPCRSGAICRSADNRDADGERIFIIIGLGGPQAAGPRRPFFHRPRPLPRPRPGASTCTAASSFIVSPAEHAQAVALLSPDRVGYGLDAVLPMVSTSGPSPPARLNVLLRCHPDSLASHPLDMWLRTLNVSINTDDPLIRH